MHLSYCGNKTFIKNQIHALLNGVDKDNDLFYATISSKIEHVSLQEA